MVGGRWALRSDSNLYYGLGASEPLTGEDKQSPRGRHLTNSQWPHDRANQHFYESQRLRLSYWAWGHEDAQPLILLHGGRDHARSWDDIAEAFAADHYVVAPDLRGHGESAWSPGSEYPTSQYAVDLLTLVERFDRPVRMICHSFGGQITFIAAGTYPGRFASIVAIEGRVPGLFEEPQPMNPERFREYVERRRSLETRQVRRYPDLESAVRRVQEMNPRLSPEQARHIAVHAVRGDGDEFIWKFDNWSRPGVRRDEFTMAEMRSFLGAIACPVLFLVGSEAGAKRGMERWAEGFADVRTLVVEGAGHWVHHDAPERVIALAREHFGVGED